MRVVCVNDKWTPDEKLVNVKHPNIGDLDVVTEQVEEYGTNYIYYRLERYGTPWYRASHFVDIPDTPAEVTEETQLQNA
jgi:hypothetical protein